jgi:GTP:adenosylcobinamide-phosphate guanylyltransferase
VASRQKISLIFPMAGQGARFGYRFKPFLEVCGKPFIEAAFAPFRPWLSEIDKVYFIFTEEQDRAHDVSGRLSRIFADVRHECAVLPAPTDGPAETLRQCLEMKAIAGPILVCDCDHAVDVDDLMRTAQDPEVACAVPTWDLAGENHAAWGIAAIAANGWIDAIAEKKLPERGASFRGVIGCYYFADAGRVRRFIVETRKPYLSDVIATYLENGEPVRSVAVHEAQFFGDPARLAQVSGDPVEAFGTRRYV